MIPSESRHGELGASRADQNGDQPQPKSPLVTALAAVLVSVVLLVGGAVTGVAGGWTPGARVVMDHPRGVGGIRDCSLHMIRVSTPYPISFVGASKDGHAPYQVVADRNVITVYFRFWDHDHAHHSTITIRTPFGERTISRVAPHICI
jgi:hypothetical protein